MKSINPELGPRASPEYMKNYKASSRYKFNNKEYQRQYFRKHPERHLFWGIKRRARLKGLDFDLEFSDCVGPGTCPILGIPLFRNTGGNKPTGNSPSVDRIDPTKGYTKDNIQVISQRANIMKNDASVEELQRFAQWVLKTYPPLSPIS